MPRMTTTEAAQRLGLTRQQVEDAIERILLGHPGYPGIDGVISFADGRDMSTVRINRRVLREVQRVYAGLRPPDRRKSQQPDRNHDRTGRQ